MDNSIGYKTTFWKLINKRPITIPTLQRDYVYGAGTEKTDMVLSHMLKTIEMALDTNKEETLDFVYGSDSLAKEFTPLDGQQRLTTLFLLHYFAALTNVEYNTDDVFNTLGRFSYATRNCTKEFCIQILISMHGIISEEVNRPDPEYATISAFIKDQDKFRGSFYSDPSIMSMLVVLDRIQLSFKGKYNLLSKLFIDSCPVDFYILDFGKFDLSDDLYNKMNSRGKPLTSFEIVKAKIHKLMRNYDKEFANQVAIKFDTSWTQFIWEQLDNTSNLKAVDPSFINFMSNLFTCLDYISGFDKQQYSTINDDCLNHNFASCVRAKSIYNVFDVFSNKTVPDKLKEDYGICLKTAIKGSMHAVDIIRLYSFFVGLWLNLSDDDFVLRQRHMRNLIANSTDQIREDRLTRLLIDTSRVMHGRICDFKDAKSFNNQSWAEEQVKDRNREIWGTLFEYEDVKEINGTVKSFCSGLNKEGSLDLSDKSLVEGLRTRLNKAKFFFEESLKENMPEYEKRAALLSIGDYSMCSYNNPAYRFFGIINGSWLNFTGYHRYGDRQRIMDVFDKIDTKLPIKELVSSAKVDSDNWRYYIINYAKDFNVAYRYPDYGYLYFPHVIDTGTYDPEDSNLDVIILQSTYYGPTNVAWKVINRLVELRASQMYNIYLDNHGGSPIILSRISNDARLDMMNDGWHLSGIDSSVLTNSGIKTVVSADYDNDENSDKENKKSDFDFLCVHKLGADYVKEGIEILRKLSTQFKGLIK